MKLTQEQFNEILKRKGIRQANPVLAGVVPAVREPNPQPALEQDSPRQQTVRSSVAIGVTLIACRKRLLDGDNLIAGFKHCRDEIARTLGIDDADPRIRWNYAQIEATRNGTIVKIEVL